MHNTATEQDLVANDIFIGKLIYRYVFPSIIAMLGMQSSGFINSMIIGHNLGSAGLSVISLVMPISLGYFSIGSLIGVGASIISSIALGRGEKDRCAEVYTLSYIVAAGLGVILTVTGLLNLDRIVWFLGADAAHFDYAYDYIRFCIMGGSAWLLIYIPLNYLRIIGKPKLAMTMLLLMSVLKIIGMGIFINLLDMGTGGLALSSVSSAALAFVFGVSRLGGKNSPLKFKWPARAFAYISAVIPAGSPSALNNICQAVKIFCVNLLFVRMGAGMYLPAYTLVNTVNDIVLAVILGISQTVLPLVGISFGEKDFRTIRIILKKALGLGNIIIGLCAVCILLAHNTISLLFGLNDDTLRWHTGMGLIFFAASLNLAFINNMIANYFSATRRVAIANIIVVSRLVLFMVLPAWLLFSMAGVYAVWISLIVTEAATLGVTFLAITMTHTRNPRLSRYLLLDSALVEHSAIIDFSVKNTTEDVDFASTKITDFCKEHDISMKNTMHISLAIEEMIIMINEHSLGKDKTEYTDVRLMVAPEHITMRIRSSGKYFNPVEYYYENKHTEAGLNQILGIAMILKMAQTVEYRETLGMNTLIITI
ncbi:MAG: ATP-binding protein [Treponema sp.]|jgi:Na+-driven multidrug efflux pump/anti-sigma regulatory factor (Ser/Thr protein kinase)|nr:ATP-binding protein [Treponema sp.]